MAAGGQGAAGRVIADDDDHHYLLCIPVHVGPPTEFARSRKSIVLFILALQAVLCLVRFVVQDFSGALWMLMTIALGLYACREDMNITYICLWGVICAVNCLFDTLALVAPVFPFGIVDYTFGEAVWKVCIPVSYALGAGIAWQLERDYRREHAMDKGAVGPASSLLRMLSTDAADQQGDAKAQEGDAKAKRRRPGRKSTLEEKAVRMPGSAGPAPPAPDPHGGDPFATAAHGDADHAHPHGLAHSDHGHDHGGHGGGHGGHGGHAEVWAADVQRRAAEKLREQLEGLSYEQRSERARENLMKAQIAQAQIAQSMYEAQMLGQHELDFYESQGARPRSRAAAPPGSFQAQVLGTGGFGGGMGYGSMGSLPGMLGGQPPGGGPPASNFPPPRSGFMAPGGFGAGGFGLPPGSAGFGLPPGSFGSPGLPPLGAGLPHQYSA
mmetsp:Transcript_129507/g.351518  ORF Transcript_129507/g.351518 Transcript_129507/m.351518 type:complete len:439 (-) Transcript_129507:43-1359(-)